MRLEQTLFNRDRWRATRKRAAPNNFLLELTLAEARQRLEVIQHTFERALLYGGAVPLADKTKVAQWIYGDIAEQGLAQQSPALVCDDEHLPVKPESFDLIVHLLMLHHANQVPQVLKNMLAALRPDGLLLACLFAPDSLCELKTCLLQAELEIKGGAAQRLLPLSDVRTLGNLLQAVGFALPVADVSSVKVRYKNFRQLLDDLRLSAQTQNFTQAPPFLRRDVLKRAEELYFQQFSDPDGKLVASFHFAWLIGWKPHPSQPQPLKPGSGKQSLAAAVKKQAR